MIRKSKNNLKSWCLRASPSLTPLSNFMFESRQLGKVSASQIIGTDTGQGDQGHKK